MIPLDSSMWKRLRTAYGAAGGIPELLSQLASFPQYDNSKSEPYFSLWSALCHQGDAYSASYAALPHLVGVIRSSPQRVSWTVYTLVSAIEGARASKNGPPVDSELSDAYFSALSEVPTLAALAASEPWDHLRSRAILGCIATAKGQHRLAMAIEQLEPEFVERFLDEWVFE